MLGLCELTTVSTSLKIHAMLIQSGDIPMNPRVLILYTGGTIGMKSSAKGFVPCEKFDQLLQEKIPDEAREQLPQITVLELSELIDSANLQPLHWTEMARQLIAQWEHYDGFVVLHGTDTMDYTAAALSYMLLGIDKPIILTGSQVPLIKLRSDGLDNLITSIDMAGHCGVPEVCIYFNNRLLRGNRSVKLNSSAFDAFDSPNFPCLARAGVRVDVDTHLLIQPSPRQFMAPVFDPAAVTVLSMYPGISAEVVQSAVDNPAVKGVVIKSYGAGNIPDANHPLINVLRNASKKGVVIVNVTQCVQGPVSQGDYATGDVLNDIGVVPGSDLTLAAAFTKLHFLIASGLSEEDIREQMTVALCGEMSQPLQKKTK
jgi:L-asparaginase